VKVAVEAGRLDTVGHDLVNHCVNDILVQGAAPLFFLDYVAFGKLEPAAVEAVVAGVAAGCRENGCALIGGETAEMPGVYTPPDFDLAGFIVGWVEEDAVRGAERARAGDVLVALASSGLHTNGYSLARRIVAERLRLGPHDRFPEHDASVADVLLAVHRSYLAAVTPVLDRVHAMAHITGGGLPGNLNRALPAHLDAVVDTTTWEVPALFRVLGEAGGVARDELFRAFNMGVGMVVAMAEQDAEAVRQAATAAGVPAWVLGHLAPGAGRVLLT
jgi:phosphoribosylformylglycinamidine cyclo-ligase